MTSFRSYAVGDRIRFIGPWAEPQYGTIIDLRGGAGLRISAPWGIASVQPGDVEPAPLPEIDEPGGVLPFDLDTEILSANIRSGTQPGFLDSLIEQIASPPAVAAREQMFPEPTVDQPIAMLGPIGGFEAAPMPEMITDVWNPVEVSSMNFYGDDFEFGSGDPAAVLAALGQDPSNPPPGPPVTGQGGPIVVAGSASIMRIIVQAAQGAGIRGLALWNRLPAWLRTAAVAAGIVAPTVVDVDWPFVGGDGGGDFLSDGVWEGNRVVKRWSANGVPFAMLADGRIAVRRKNGTVKIYRPPKPIVIYGSGATDIRALLRADGAVDRQIKKLSKVIRRRNPSPRKTPAKPSGHTHDGTTIVQNS